MTSRQHKTPGSAPGVFISALLLSLAATLAQADCTPPRQLEAARLERVVDGDTVQLRGGERVRLIGLNAPELAHDGRPAEPLAARSKQALADLLPRDRDIYLQPGAKPRDHYGRRLAHLFLRRDGGSIEAEQLRRGLGFQVALPPDTTHADCLARAEGEARKQRLGVWAERYFAPRDSRNLKLADAGFRRVRLQVEQVRSGRGGWWLEGGPLAVWLSREALPASAEACAPACWRGRPLTLRGWIANRSGSQAVRDRGHPPLLLRIGHPAMIESMPAAATPSR